MIRAINNHGLNHFNGRVGSLSRHWWADELDRALSFAKPEVGLVCLPQMGQAMGVGSSRNCPELQIELRHAVSRSRIALGRPAHLPHSKNPRLLTKLKKYQSFIFAF